MRLLLGGYYFFYFGLVGVYIIFMPKVLLDFGYSPFEVGVIYSSAPFMRFLLPFIFRHFLSLTPNIYRLSLALSFLMTLLFISSIDEFWIYLIVNLLFGGAMGISLPYVETIALSSLSKNSYGKVRLWGSLGFIVVSLWLGLVLETSTQALYYLSAMSLFTLIFGVSLTRFDNSPHSSLAEDSQFSLQRYWVFWVGVFLMQVGFGGFYNFFTIYESSHGISLEIISWMWSFGVLCEIFMLYFQAKLLQRNLLNILMFATFITAIRWMLLFLFGDSVLITFISQSLHAFSFALYHTAAITYIYSLYTQKKLAQQFFLGIAFGLGGSVGALVSGKIYGEYLFLIEAIITMASLVALIIHKRRKEYINL